MAFGKAMLVCLYHSRRRDRTSHKSNTDRRKWFRRKRLRGQPCPEAMAISSHGREPRDSVRLNEIVYLAAFDVGGAVIASTKAGVACAGPRFRYSRRQVLWIGAHIQGRRGVSPNLPGCLRVAQSFEEPGFLLCAKNGLSGAVFREISDLHPGESNRTRRLAAVVGASRVQNLHRLFRNKLRKIVARQWLGLFAIHGFFGPIAALVGHDQFHVAAPPQGPITL